MLSKATIKYIQSLKQKKYRVKNNAFLVEGEKMVLEAVKSDFEVAEVYTSSQPSQNSVSNAEVITKQQMEKLSTFSTSSDWLAVVKMNTHLPVLNEDEFILVLDGVKDPGNLGTILRIADWYGVNTVICSSDCVDVYNPKTVQSTMGALFRLNIQYEDLADFIPSYLQQFPENGVYGALMNGENIYAIEEKQKGLLIMGSESHGIREEVEKLVKKRITIPGSGRSESLNVGVATGIICSEFFRNSFQ